MINVTLTMTNEQLETLAEKVAALMGKALPAADAPDLMTAAEAARYLHCGRRRIYDLMSARRLPKMREGGRVLIRRADLDRLVEEA